MIDTETIKGYIPHRDPFLFVDRVLEVETGSRILAEKRFGPEEDFFRGHFPGNPIVPGVIIVEALAQTGGVLIYASFTDELSEKGHTGAYLAGLERVRFRKAVLPDDIVRMEVRMKKKRSRVFIFEGEASVGESKVAEAEIMVSLY
ncbi:MAG: 3-hydroxyacyl-ACP dehydratase FabZ [Deltaproteobacteria bacterium]